MDNSTHYLDGSLTEITAPVTPSSHPIYYGISTNDLAVLQRALADESHIVVTGAVGSGKTLLTKAIANRTGAQLAGEIYDVRQLEAFAAGRNAAYCPVVGETFAIENPALKRIELFGRGPLTGHQSYLLELQVTWANYPDPRRQLSVVGWTLASN